MPNIGNIYVPDDGPKGAKILLVGESPGETEERERKPFVGESGSLLVNCLSRAGVNRDEIRLANLCHYRPYGNKFELLLGSRELESGKTELAEYIRNYRPVVIGALGRYPTEYLTSKSGITKYRGSILSCSLSGCEDIKVIPAYHPSYVLRSREKYPIFAFDIQRIVGDSEFREFRRTPRDYHITPEGLDLFEWAEKLSNSERLYCDIESVKESTYILCVGFSPTPNVSVSISFEEPAGREAIIRILSSPARKYFHNGIFDITMLRENGVIVNNYAGDTMINAHALEPELPKGLDFLTSIYTREPYYKEEGRADIPVDTKAWGKKADKGKLYIYNCKDTAVTAEIHIAQEPELEADKYAKRIADFELELQEVALHISQHGMLIDLERRELMKKALVRRWAKLQFVLNGLAGEPVNVRSPKLKDLLYGKDKLGLPPRRKYGGGITTDEDAIVACITYCKNHIASLSRDSAIRDWKVKLEICNLVLAIRGIRQQLSNYILAKISSDNRLRSTYKVAGPETGRWAAEGYVDGTGLNAQTFPRESVDIPDDLDQEFNLRGWIDQLTKEDSESESADEDVVV